ncbi:MAG: hypothetical protein NTW16_08555 [Bacteroidetes bacterium]|nr:hypothetical protein [Bacteroidota bacterium]
MKSSMGIRMVLFFLVLAIGCFDKHLSYYCPVEITLLTEADTLPAHSDLPVKSCDYHEDITLKNVFCVIPAPLEFLVPEYRIFNNPVQHVPPKSVWQPPEMSA